jgi:hypothetical protein
MTWTTFVRTHVKITVYKTKYITKEKYPITGLVTEKKEKFSLMMCVYISYERKQKKILDFSCNGNPAPFFGVFYMTLHCS